MQSTLIKYTIFYGKMETNQLQIAFASKLNYTNIYITTFYIPALIKSLPLSSKQPKSKIRVLLINGNKIIVNCFMQFIQTHISIRDSLYIARCYNVISLYIFTPSS